MTQFERIPELPTLEPGLQLLRTDDDEPPVRPLQSLVVDTLLLGSSGGTAVWIDALDHARTDTLTTLAPSSQILDRIHLARGFTAYQHAAIVERLFEALQSPTAHTSDQQITPDEVSVIVCPAVDALYRADDVGSETARELLYRVLARLQTLARQLEVPVLASQWQRDSLSEPFANAADGTITCRRTDHGLRFETPDTETLVYPLDDGSVQTTLAYWVEILDARRPLYDRYSVGTTEPISSATLEG